MSMIGNQLAAGIGSIAIANDSFNGTGSATVFTLSQTVSAVTDIEVLVDNVQQSPYDSSYSVSGTTLTFSAAPAAGTNNIYVIYNHARTITTNQVVPDDGSVTTAKLHDDAVTHGKLPAGTVLQTVYNEHITGTAYTSAQSLHDLFSATITPTSTTSKILISMSVQHGPSNVQNDFGLHLKRGSTRIGGRTGDTARGGANTWFCGDDYLGSASQNQWNLFTASWQYLDSPSTTSATTYTVGAYVHNEFYLNRFKGADNAGGSSYISLQEIAQ